MADVADTRVETGRPSPLALVRGQVRYANRSFWRTPIAAFFTVVFPLIFLVLISALLGDEVVGPPSRDVRVTQFITPSIAAFAATLASFTSLAVGLAMDRDQGVLKRIRATPIPPWAFLAGRVGSAVWIAFVSVALMVAVGVAFFGVQLLVDRLPAALLALAVGIGCFAALGLLVVGVTPSAASTQAVANAVILPLAFVSGVFVPSDQLPDWLREVAAVFPLAHFVEAMTAAFDPFATGRGFAWDHLAVMAAWGLAALAGALRWFRWEPARKGGAQAAPTPTARRPAGAPLRSVETVGRPGVAALGRGQVGYGVRKVFRNPLSVFFTILFPIVLVLLLPTVFGGEALDFRGGIPLAQFLAPVLAVYGAATAAYTDFSHRVASDRDEGVLKRLRGTPLPASAYLGGRVAAALAVAFASLVVTVAVGVAVHDVEIVWRALPGLVASVAVGIACFACLGLAIAAVAPDAESVPAIANATLLPLAFFSDIFLVGDLPAWMDTVGWIFPLKHFANAVADAFNPTVPGAGFFWDHLAVMAAWGVAGALVALRFWTWVPRSSGGRRARRRDDETAGAAAGGR